MLAGVVATAIGCMGMLLMVPTADAVDLPAGQLVQELPADGTPHVLDGRVLSVEQVGDTIILGGTFTTARNDDSQTVLSRSGILAFNANTGQISNTFVPDPNGTVNVVIPAGDGLSVFVGGSFGRIGGVARRNLARVRVADGTVMTGFNTGAVPGQVKDLRLKDGRLWVAGAFTSIAGQPQVALATVNPTSGAFDGYMTSVIAGLHNGGVTAVLKIDITPSGGRLIAIGNFDTLNGVKNHQFFMLDLTGPSAAPANFRTAFYETPCAQAFDSYMRDLDFSPDGSFFVVSTTGAYGGSTVSCDTTSRWETGATGTGIQASWVDYTGGDTTYGVEVTGSVVYVGGHFRWQNNAFAADRAGPGAVPRDGIAALDPINGLPFSWNPGRAQGVGVFDFLHTSQGLWVASDTERIGNFQMKGRIALLPAAGAQMPAIKTPGLPNDIFVAETSGPQSDPSVLHRVNAGGPALTASTGIDWAADTAAAPNPNHNSGSSRSTYGTVPNVDASVPAGTPVEIFSSELWDPPTGQEQQWNFSVAAGTPIQVRLYFANRCTCSDNVGERVFNVNLDGARVLNNFDMVAQFPVGQGHNRGFMRSFNVSSDGNVDIDLLHVVENPLINGIEIVRTDLPPASTSGIVRRSYNNGNVGPSVTVPAGGFNWSNVRGAFMVNGSLYTAWFDGSFTRQTFDGTTYGAPVLVNTHDLLVPLADWRADIQAATGMFYDSGRIYFTRSQSNQLFYRYFTPENDLVGSKRFVASNNVTGIDFAQVRGMFNTGTRLFWATPNGNLNEMGWAHGALSGAPVGGTAATVSGPALDGRSWTSRSLFLYQDSNGGGVGLPPTAAFTFDCLSRTCDFDASGSTALGGTITGYGWDFGDGAQDTGVTPAHTFTSDGDHTVSLTVTTASGGTDTETHVVTVQRVNELPAAAFTFSCDALVCAFDASGSDDPDGSIGSYAWDFGGTATGSGVATSHTFGSAGPQTVTLTVTDNDGGVGSTARVVNPSESAVEFVVANSTNGNRAMHTVGIPVTVQAGDTLVLFMTTNSTDRTIDPLPGWTALESEDGLNIRARAWTRTATAGDAGSLVTVGTSGIVKSDLTVAAYRGSAGTAVTASEALLVNGSNTTHTTPTVQVADAGSWLVSYWAEKSSVALTWTGPAGQALRSSSTGTGGSKVSAIMTDSDGSVPTGAQGALAATTSAATTRVAMFSVVIKAS